MVDRGMKIGIYFYKTLHLEGRGEDVGRGGRRGGGGGGSSGKKLYRVGGTHDFLIIQ